MFVHTRAILPCCIFGPCPSVRMPLSPDRGLPLCTNRVLHARPQSSNERPPPFIVGLIRSPKSCFTTLIQDCTLNLSITHSLFCTHYTGPVVVFTFATLVGPLDPNLDLQCSQSINSLSVHLFNKLNCPTIIPSLVTVAPW